MNRFIIGGILAAMVVLLTGSLNRFFTDRDQAPSLATRSLADSVTSDSARSETVSDLGSLPVEQAGQLVRRQSDVNAGGVSATSDSVFTEQGAGATPPGGRAIISPANTGTVGSSGTVNSAPGNVIPRTGAAATSPTTVGDIAPIQPDLVQPGAGQRPTDPELDSIPALW